MDFSRQPYFLNDTSFSRGRARRYVEPKIGGPKIPNQLDTAYAIQQAIRAAKPELAFEVLYLEDETQDYELGDAEHIRRSTDHIKLIELFEPSFLIVARSGVTRVDINAILLYFID
jgi:hypothetical protein